MSDDKPKSLTREEALELLLGGEEGIKKWNEYRRRGGSTPDLRDVGLGGADMTKANLSDAYLREADLRDTRLRCRKPPKVES